MSKRDSNRPTSEHSGPPDGPWNEDTDRGSPGRDAVASEGAGGSGVKPAENSLDAGGTGGPGGGPSSFGTGSGAPGTLGAAARESMTPDVAASGGRAEQSDRRSTSSRDDRDRPRAGGATPPPGVTRGGDDANATSGPAQGTTGSGGSDAGPGRS